MDRNPHIKNFVQQVLGCTCPDKVFGQIEDRQVSSPVSPHNRSITIGRRLLVYIWEVEEAAQFREKFLAMLAAGKKERDRRGLNRFRAVIAVSDNHPGVAAEATLHFSEFDGRDDRIHFHVTPRDIVDDL
jgi:hypothetical protein